MTLKVVHVEMGRNLYGGALQVYYLLRGLKQQDCHNVLVCRHRSGIARIAGEVVDTLHVLPAFGDFDLRYTYWLWRVLRAERPDLVHLHSRPGLEVVGGAVGHLVRTPVIYSRRQDNPEPPWWVRRKYRLFDRVITISAAIRRVLLSEGVPPEKVVCVHSAVDSDYYRPGCDRAWFAQTFGIAPGTRVIGMSAQFIERKGHRYLLAAVPAILQEFPSTRFLLFGKGPLESEIHQQIAAAGLQAHVQLSGFRDDLERVLPCLDLLVHPADREGLGVSLLQAAAAGIPIVGSDAGGIPEVVRDHENGLLVPAGDVSALSAAVRELLRQPELARQMGERGRRLVKEQFSLTAMVTGNLQVYRELLRD